MVAPQTHEVARTIAGRYRIEQQLGRGGDAVAYRAIDESTGRRVALKQLRERGDPGRRLRFRREFHTMATLVHPCVVEVFDFGVATDGPYYTMELLEGPELKKLAPMEPIAACRILRDVASALAFLHVRGLVHRDVSPGNVRCTTSGRAKLIDFGIVTTTGVAGELAGTPRYIAPEALRGMSIDMTADLFGLGALAYWLLTGRHAYDARSVNDLEAVWARDVVRPSTLVPDLPPALEKLVMSMLSLERLARPSSAAEVVDRLGAIAGLERDPELAVVSGYLSSAKLIGREVELQRLRRRIRRLAKGQGAAVSIVAPAGSGKSRLLREAGLEAQLAGATLARVACEPSRGPYAAVRALARELLAVAPDDAIAAAREHAPVIGRVVPELRARVAVDLAALHGEAREDRLEVQAHMQRWLFALAARRRLVIIVDDVQRCDDASAAVIAALAHAAAEHPILIICALREDEPAQVPELIGALQRASTRMTLHGLSVHEMRELARSLFGDVPGIAKLTHWLHDRSSGSPLHALELARHLTETGVVKFVDGVWMIPDALGDAVPQGIAQAADARVAALDAPTRALAELIAVHSGEVPLDRTQKLAGVGDEELLAQLDTLEYAGVIERVESGHRFRHDVLREAVLRGLPDDRRRALHLAIGRLLEAQSVGTDNEAEVGWHLFRGGERARGAKLMDRAASRLYDAQAHSDAVPLIKTVLEVYREDHASPRELLRLQHMLVACGTLIDRNLAVTYAPSTITGYAHYAGLDLARTLGRILGRPIGLLFAFLWAWLRWLVVLPFRRLPNPIESGRYWVYAMTAAGPVYSTSYQIDELSALVRDAEILSIARDRMPHGALLFVTALRDYLLGEWASMREKVARTIHISRTDFRTPGLRPVERKYGLAGSFGLLALEALTERYPAEELEELRKVGVLLADTAIMQVRIGYHRFRGEEDESRRLELAAEPLFIQLGSVWGHEAWMATLSAMAYAFHHDLMGMRRTIAKLQRLTDVGFNYGRILDIARSDYHRELGQLDQARVLGERVLAETPSRELLLRQLAILSLARTYVAAGDAARARPLALELREIARDPRRAKHAQQMVAEELLVRCDALEGDLSAAIRRADAALVEAEAHGLPSMTGLMHELRAELALQADDRAGYLDHVAAMRRWLVPTRNPALIARIDRLEALGRVDIPSEGTADPNEETVRLGSPRHLGSAAGQEIPARALATLIAATGAVDGYLYVVRSDGRLELAAPIDSDEPDESIVEALRELLEHDASDIDVDSTRVDRPEPRTPTWRAFALRTQSGERTIDVAGALLRRGPLPLRSPADELCAELARVLRERLGCGVDSLRSDG